MFPAARLNKEAEEGWELITAFSIVQLGRQEGHFLLKRGPLM